MAYATDDPMGDPRLLVDDVEDLAAQCAICGLRTGVKVAFCRNCGVQTWVHKSCAERHADEFARLQCTNGNAACTARYDVMYTNLDLSTAASASMSATFARCVPQRRWGRTHSCLVTKPVLASLLSTVALTLLIGICMLDLDTLVPLEIAHTVALALGMLPWFIYPRDVRGYVTIYKSMRAAQAELVLEMAVTVLHAIASTLVLVVLKRIKALDYTFAIWVGVACVGVLLPIDCFLLLAKRRIHENLHDVPMRLVRADASQ